MGTISSYPAATSVTDDDVLVGNDGTTTKKFPATTVRAYTKTGASVMALNTKTSNYTLALGDADDLVIVCTDIATANQVIVPPDTSVNFPIGSQIEILQLGLGQTTLVAGSIAVTIGGTATLKLAQRYARAILLKTAPNVWAVSGEMALT